MGPGSGDDLGSEKAAAPERRYANHLAIELSMSEVEFRFGQRLSAYAMPTVQSLVISSPVHLVTFGRAIQASIASYESRFGRIPDGSDPDGTKA